MKFYILSFTCTLLNGKMVENEIPVAYLQHATISYSFVLYESGIAHISSTSSLTIYIADTG